MRCKLMTTFTEDEYKDCIIEVEENFIVPGDFVKVTTDDGKVTYLNSDIIATIIPEHLKVISS